MRSIFWFGGFAKQNSIAYRQRGNSPPFNVLFTQGKETIRINCVLTRKYLTYGRFQMKRTVLTAGFIAVCLILGMASCASTGGAAGASSGGASGTASATAQGFGGPVTVTVTVENGKITGVEADGPGETQGIGSRAIANLPGAIVAANSVEVDGISGASVTSQAIKAAVQEALGKIGN
jgi:uncharacterized protein with FMN-binding domain